MFSLYDSTMESLLSKDAPRRKIKLRKKANCPWFDKECLASKRMTIVTSVVSRKNLTANEGNIGELVSTLEGDSSNTNIPVISAEVLKTYRATFEHSGSIEDVPGDFRTLWKYWRRTGRLSNTLEALKAYRATFEHSGSIESVQGDFRTLWKYWRRTGRLSNTLEVVAFPFHSTSRNFISPTVRTKLKISVFRLRMPLRQTSLTAVSNPRV